MPQTFVKIGRVYLRGYDSGYLYVDLAGGKKPYKLIKLDDSKLKIVRSKVVVPGEHTVLKEWNTLQQLILDVYAQFAPRYNDNGIKIVKDDNELLGLENTTVYKI